MKSGITIILLICFLSLNSQSMWYEDYKLHVSGAYLDDCSEMWRNPDTWSETRSKINTHVILGSTLNIFIDSHGESFLTDTLSKVLVDDDINLAIHGAPDNIEYLYNLLLDAGVNVTHIALQNELTETINGVSPKFEPYLSRRVTSLVSKVASLRAFAPSVKYGIIDSRPSKGWDWRNAYASAANRANLDFIILDCPYGYIVKENTINYSDISVVENFVQNIIGLEYGLMISDNIGSGESLENIEEYARNSITMTPDYFIVSSNPDFALDAFEIIKPSPIDEGPQKQYWYEETNVRMAGGYPDDMDDMFREPEKWKELRSKIDKYVLRGISFDKFTIEHGTKFITDTLAPVLVRENIGVVIDNPPHNLEYYYLLLRSAGVTVTHINLQSVLSQPRGQNPRIEPELSNRINEVRDRLNAIREFAPNVKLGLIDARPTKGWDYRDAYKRVVEIADIDFLILDCPYSYPARNTNISWSGFQQVGDYIMNDLGIDYGIILTDNVGGQTSEQLFRNNTLAFANQIKTQNYDYDYLIFMSWYNNPTKAIPEYPSYGHTMTSVAREAFNLFPKQEDVIVEPIIQPIVEEHVYTLRLIKVGNEYKIEHTDQIINSDLAINKYLELLK